MSSVLVKPSINEIGESDINGKWEIEIQDFTQRKVLCRIRDKLRIAKKRYIYRLGEKDPETGVFDKMSLLKYEIKSHRESIEQAAMEKREKKLAKQKKKELKKQNRLHKRIWKRIQRKRTTDQEQAQTDQSELNQIKFVLENFKQKENSA